MSKRGLAEVLVLGTLVGLTFLVGYVASAVDSEFALVSPGEWAVAGLVIAGVALVVGLLLRKTVGIALMFAMVGAVIGAVIRMVQGHFALGFALLVHAVAFWVVSNMLAFSWTPLLFARRRRVPVPAGGPTPLVRAVAAGEVPAPQGSGSGLVAAEDGQFNALVESWDRQGEPVRDASELVEGHVYGLGIDVGIYRGRFYGRRFEGFPEIDVDPQVANWHAFEAAWSQNTPWLPGIRISDAELTDGRFRVVALPVEQEEARRVFDLRRAQYYQHRDRSHR